MLMFGIQNVRGLDRSGGSLEREFIFNGFGIESFLIFLLECLNLRSGRCVGDDVYATLPSDALPSMLQWPTKNHLCPMPYLIPADD